MNVYVGFDFSMNKPAATVCCGGRFYFYFWPLDLLQYKVDKYAGCGVRVRARGLKSVSTSKALNTQIVLVHTIRSTDLANMIIADLDALISDELRLDGCDLYVCSEGLSYASKGNETLNLATYKGVLLSKIYEHYPNLRRLFTYSPNTLKATAGCATKEKRGEKINMIRAFAAEPLDNPFRKAVLSGELTMKKNFFEGVDDLVDSYWALRTMLKKEGLPL